MLTFTKPKKLSLPILIGIPHAGTEIPAECRDSFVSGDSLLLARDSDLFVDELYANTTKFGAAFLSTSISRYVIDCNRDPNEIDASFVQGAKVVQNPKHLGLIAHKTMQGEVLLKSPLTQDELKKRIALYHEPFHQTTRASLEEIKKQFGFCINLEGHSMPARGSMGHIDNSSDRADVVLGDLDGTSCSPVLTDFLESFFKTHGLSVARNHPYKGAYVTQTYGCPNENSHSILIELNRKLYMNENTHEKLPVKFEKLQNVLNELLRSIALLKISIT